MFSVVQPGQRGVVATFAVAAALFPACETRINPPKPADDSGAPQLTIYGLDPASGPASGGTPVRVLGAAFSPDSSARVGEQACASLTFVSGTELVCVTPSGAPGLTQLVVQDGSAAASATFSWLADDTGRDTGPDTGQDTGPDTGRDTSPDTGRDTGPDTGRDTASDTAMDSGAVAVPVDYCHLQYPCSQTLSSGATSESVYGWVYQADATPGPGVAAGMRVEVGYGPDGSDPASGGWTWATMRYNLDKDGLVPGDLANDEWMGTFVAPAAGAWDFCVRASADDGVSWTYCDGGGASCPGSGSDDGYDPADAGALTVW